MLNQHSPCALFPRDPVREGYVATFQCRHVVIKKSNRIKSHQNREPGKDFDHLQRCVLTHFEHFSWLSIVRLKRRNLRLIRSAPTALAFCSTWRCFGRFQRRERSLRMAGLLEMIDFPIRKPTISHDLFMLHGENLRRRRCDFGGILRQHPENIAYYQK